MVGINYAPESTGIGPYTTDVCEHLADIGGQVTAIVGRPHYPQWLPSPAYRGMATTTEMRNGVTVKRVPHYVPARQNAFRRGLYEATFLVSAARLARGIQPDVVIGVSPSLSGAVIATTLAGRLKIPSGLVIQDLMGSAAKQSGIDGGRSVASLVARAEAATARAATGIAVIAPAFGEALLRVGVDPAAITLLPNYSHIEPVDICKAEARTQLGWRQDLRLVLHTGNMGLKQDLANVIEAARAVERTHPDLVFTFVGGGSQESELRDQALGLPNIQFLGELSDADYSLALAAADILLVNERSTVHDMSLPSKLTSYMTVGKPIIAAVARGGATERELKRSKSAILVDAGRPELLACAVVDLLERPDLARKLGESGHKHAEMHLGREAALHRLGNWVGGLVGIEPVPFVGQAGRGRPIRSSDPGASPKPAPPAPEPKRSLTTDNELPLATLALPVFNESSTISESLRHLLTQLQDDSAGYSWEILIVDDGSTDDTTSVVEGLVWDVTIPVRVVRHPVNRGLGSTLSTLFREAKGDVVVTIDADLSYDAAHVGRLIRALETSGASVVVASPYMPGGRTHAVPRDLALRSRTANNYLGVMSPLRVRTFTGMVRAYDASFVRSLSPLRSGATANVEILLAASRRGLLVREIPATLDWTGKASRRGRSTLLAKGAMRESLLLIRDGVRFRRHGLATAESKLPGANSRNVVIDLTRTTDVSTPHDPPILLHDDRRLRAPAR